MATRSTVPTVKAALVAALAARPGLAGVKVSWGWPGPEAVAEMVVVGELAAGTQTVPTLRATRVQREERYDLAVTCFAARHDATAADQRLAEERAFALAGEVEDLLASDPRLGLSDIAWARVSQLELASAPADRGWVAQVTVTVSVVARLT